MDNMMGRVDGKISAQEMIKANTAAEAAHREQIESQNKQYEEEIAVLRQNAKKLEDRLNNIEDVLDDLKNGKIEADRMSKELGSAVKELNESLADRFDKSDEATHDVGVRIYRNVQASVADEQKKQLDEIREDLKKQMESIRSEFTVLVRQLDSMQRANRAKNRGLMPLVVVTLLAVIADLALLILRIVGLV
ncbi:MULTISPECIES: hypothetical protein [unclassified Butyrivibrio]|uniref:hypothetical protein n=1 Tax=unclassified Butyrivibrio TaxID=2639466 RepID=UPI0003B3AFAF|nr:MULTISPECIES: hypothetical protein [unclassified Butyrivibrio]SEM49640.1 hypothetical protein SAMN04487770_14216 [Butyrivibrio sp. ob235]